MPLIPRTAENILRWASFTASIRNFLTKQGFIEVSTPHLVSEGAFESTIDPLKVNWVNGQAELHTSPEIQMKSVLKVVDKPIFQICHCFRDDFEGPHHSREFTMLELYEKNKTYKDTMNLVKGLIKSLAPTNIEFKAFSVQEIFLRKTGLSLSELTNLADFRDAVTRGAIVEIAETDSWEDIFFRILIERIEPRLPFETPVFLYDYPPPTSPLSKAIGATAERFELYWKGMELCNGCTELADKDELRRRHLAESEKRRIAGKKPHPFSESLFEATKEIGNCSGVAIGLDRLFLALYGAP